MSVEPAVEIQSVTKTFGETVAVKNLSLSVPKGSIYGLIGPNGSGKTTTIRMIMSIFYPDTGSVRLFGREVGERAFEEVGYLPEERGLYKKMKVFEVLQFYGELKTRRKVDDEIRRWLDRLELSEWGDKKVETLSKGMSQKIQFIAAVVSRPSLLILDEPFSGLDPVNTDALRTAILEMQAQGATVILSTHDMQVAERMCDFICMIFRGEKVLDGTLAEIQSQYGTDTVRVRSGIDGAVLARLPGVEQVQDYGQLQELRLKGDADAQEILRQILSRTRVTSFELVRPSLHDIFVRVVRSDDLGNHHE